MSTSAIEHRFIIECARYVARDCVDRAEVVSNPDPDTETFAPRTTSEAVEWFRKQGWTTMDGTVTCPTCNEEATRDRQRVPAAAAAR